MRSPRSPSGSLYLYHESYVLDAYAILALLGGEKGAHAAAELVSQARANLFVSAVNVGEVYYTLRRWRGESATVEAEIGRAHV